MADVETGPLQFQHSNAKHEMETQPSLSCHNLKQHERNINDVDTASLIAYVTNRVSLSSRFRKLARAFTVLLWQAQAPNANQVATSVSDSKTAATFCSNRIQEIIVR